VDGLRLSVEMASIVGEAAKFIREGYFYVSLFVLDALDSLGESY
jgi:hypothetical protein